MNDLQNEEILAQAGLRAPGGGRPAKLDILEGIDEAFLSILQDHTAGSPTDQELKWTNLSRKEIQENLLKAGFDVSRRIVKQLLHKHKFVRRKLLKKSPPGSTRIEISSLKKSTK